ncbi:hypothetical protein ABZ807_19395 [Micromonospora sp. NPDC047548]|uniref:hypothetical protein n=1 Tax=Micromonospora sp. NPDC047548 TaxID=3155624 RepID=UPI0033F22E10
MANNDETPLTDNTHPGQNQNPPGPNHDAYDQAQQPETSSGYNPSDQDQTPPPPVKPDEVVTTPSNDHQYDQTSTGAKDPSTIKPVGDMPKVPDEDTVAPADQDVLTVNTAALQKFADNLAKLQEHIDTSAKYVNLVDVKAGHFGAGYALTKAINLPDGGLQADTYAFMGSVKETLFDVRTAIANLIKDYDDTEELNNLTGDKLADLLREPFGDINNLSDYGNSDSGTVGNTEEKNKDTTKPK